MTRPTRTEEQLRAENADLRARLEKAEDTLRAIHTGEVDALIVKTGVGPRGFALQGLGAESSRFRGEILAQVSDAVIAVDADQRVTYLNAAAERQYRVSASAVIGHQLSEIFTRRWPNTETEAAMWSALREHGEWRGEIGHLTHDGREIAVETSITALRAASGAPAGYVAIIRDITERVRAEAEIRATEELVRTIAENSTHAMVMMDERGFVTYCNQVLLNLTGYNAEEIRSAPLHDLIHHHYPDGRPYPLQECPIDRALPEDFSVRAHQDLFFRKDGSTFEVLCAASPIFKDGRPVSTVIEIRDVTEQNAARRKLIQSITERKEAEEKLLQSNERMRLATEATAVGIWEWHVRTNTVRWDAQMFRLYGIPPTVDGCVSYSDWSAAVVPEDLPENERLLQDTVRRCGQSRREFRIHRRDDGEVRDIEAVDTVRVNERGEAEWVVGTNLDITERKLAAEKLGNAKEAAEKANAAKDHFLAVLSHELRTPLMPVLMAVGMLQRDPELSAEVRDDLAMIKRNIELETKLIDDLLDLNRITCGKLPLDLEPIDLNQAIRNACEICSASVRERGIRLEMELSADTGLVVADAARLQQVLWNVLNNAIKFTPVNGLICVSAKRLDGARCEVRVTDSGTGISPEVLPHIFDAFEQGGTSVTRQFGGLGLGLAICKALVALHHGSIRAESSGAGTGATFIIELPSAAPVMETTNAQLQAADAQGSRQLRLLVVEDHPDTARMLARLLSKAGFAVVTASDVASALAAVERESFSLLICDIGLPDGSGLDVMRALRARSSIPGIAMSGYGMEEDVRLSHEAGFSEHLVKPLDFSKLQGAIRRVTENCSG